jgi:polyhydroxyalkanoate synthase
VLKGEARRDAYQPMARWVADNPPFPASAFREWISAMYKENRLVNRRMRLRDKLIDLSQVEQSLLVVTAGADHIAPPQGTRPLLDLVGSDDVTCIDRPGGHIGLMAGSKARKEIWPDICDWLSERSNGA